MIAFDCVLIEIFDSIDVSDSVNDVVLRIWFDERVYEYVNVLNKSK